MTKFQYPLFLVMVLLGGCGGDPQSPVQHWEGAEFAIETRPNPPLVGFNEILVVATRPHRLPEFDLLVFIRMSPDEPWLQSIQDGQTGIFRRALAMQTPGPHTLAVRLERQGQEKILEFPLVVAKD